MTRPLATSPIWNYIRRRDFSGNGKGQSRLTVIVDANDLRAEAFTAGLVSSFAKDSLLGERCSGSNLPKAIKKGLNSARELVSEGFCAEPNETPHYPLSQIMNDQGEHYKIASVLIPLENSTTDRWSIFLNVMGDTMEIARFIVQNGPDDVLSQVQTARFGKLLTADRREMEGFRAITNLVEEYIRGQQIEPLSIGIFGPPGSGKSFAVTQVIEGASHTAKIEELPFNLSQFNHYSDLLSSFQLIRDETLSGSLPMALFDEFDAEFESTSLGWLRYFLAPMQDGRFLDHGQMHHPLGRYIFVFIGGTSSKFADFIGPEGEHQTHFKQAKGPDFVSRLRGYADFHGSDKNGDDDKMYSIRRAILLRALLERRMVMSNNHLTV
ncbi:uncharacterized protein BDW43DRAFT_314266 [Aspergillus alliaceus]|uniref:uncharacterized protein n=1 Tax=Petromyces alliaceus TaxID=209559 RepID=UPI0012A62791|nr:uncharacterized protein BDW43DRAFT_314266 [Aspergillus alliaceus]KAB8230212.1 hypothetical protein BDW43DRAFT_314266 [Aspergillus alliaceus]